MRWLFHITMVILLSHGPALSKAQNNFFSGIVLDSVSSIPLEGVHVSGGVAGDAYTDPRGEFTLPWKGDPSLELEFSFTGYSRKRELIQRSQVHTGEKIVLYLTSISEELPSVVIRPGPQVVYQREDLHVGAYHMNADGLWILVHERPGLWHSTAEVGQQVFKGARIHLLDTLFQERCKIELPGEVLALYHDHAKRPVIEGRRGAWSVELDEGDIVLNPMDRERLHASVLPWTDSIPGFLLGTNISAFYPAFDHYAYDPIKDKAEVICSIEDKHLVELYRSQYKYMSGADKVVAMNLEHDLGIDKEIIAGYMTSFHTDQYFKVPYAPLFVVKDTLCVFDRYSGFIRRFSYALEEISAAPFNGYLDHERWSSLIQDVSDDTVYAIFERGMRTWLRSVDPVSGEFGPALELTHPFPEEIQVNNGYVYYVYRPFGSLQRRTLYREVLQ